MRNWIEGRIDHDRLHDVIWEALGISPESDVIDRFVKRGLPNSITYAMNEWGCDTVVCDQVYEWITDPQNVGTVIQFFGCFAPGSVRR